MEVMMSILIGMLFAGGIYMVLSQTMLRIVFGTSLLSHATLLLLITMGELKRGAAPILTAAGGPYVDPLPQALILTAIVIGFGTTAFSIVLAYQAYQTLGTDNLEKCRGIDDEH
ncbi:MAG: Na(+)/H(+) antiporter subunit C [Clostridia bacterium]|nr:Na(+)/H(+) antiporter subunit C [Clostridia bacterium]MDD4798162.1 Na(+)/H(+) antiporter subunit C [Clostridia bacterium]